jgi:23S rRNA (guanosine2251-2'-O)-methyltransferase
MAKQSAKKFRKTKPAVRKSLNWLWGRSGVFETLEAGRWRVYELFLTEEVFAQNKDFLAKQKANGVELEVMTSQKLTELAQATDHQGIVARVSKYPYDTLENFEKTLVADHSALSASAKPIAVLIDRVQDVFNFASLLRCCKHAGVGAVFVGEFCQCQVTTQVSRLSSGAVNHLSIVQSSDLLNTAKRLKELGLTLLAVDPASTQAIDHAGLDVSLGLLVGSDLHGLDPNLMALCDQRICIPSQNLPATSHPTANHQATQLSPSVSAGIVLYETRRQQRIGGRP